MITWYDKKKIESKCKYALKIFDSIITTYYMTDFPTTL